MSEDAVTVAVSGFTVSDALFDDLELIYAAEDIRSDIGARLSSLGTSCGHGVVTVTIGERSGSSDATV